MYAILDQLILWTRGVRLLAPGAPARAGFRGILNPAVVGIAAGMLLAGLGIRLPELVLRAISGASAMATPMAMLYIGASFCFTGVHSCIGRAEIYIGAALKLIVVPLALCFARESRPCARI